MSKKRKWLYKKCKAFVPDSGKCKTKVPYRYNDYCEKDDCPKRPEIHAVSGVVR